MDKDFDGLSGKPFTISQLIFKQLQETISAEEQAILEDWLQESEKNRQLFTVLTDKNKLQVRWNQFYAGLQEKDAARQLVKTNVPTGRRIFYRWLGLAAASVILLILAYGLFTRNDKKADDGVTSVTRFKNEVNAPASNRAVLTLDDGRTIYLDSVGNGQLTSLHNVKIEKLADGQIAYQQQSASSVASYNTVTNPRGSKVIDIMLEDGSHVWLNNESSIRFPVAFITGQRKVEITGEAYFEVAKDAKRKFVVVANGSTTEVLGTHFNVNAYSNNIITLVEGSVRVKKDDREVILKPGEQSKFNNNSLQVVQGVDVEDAIAWKNGLIVFDKSSIDEIFSRIERWYDVRIIVKGVLNVPTMTGGLPRSLSLTEALKVLEENSKITFTIEGKTVTVTP